MGPACPTDDDAREGAGHEEAVPGVHDPGVFGLEMKCADGCAGELRQLDGAHLGAVDGTARAVGGEDGGAVAAVDEGLEPEQTFTGAA